MIENHALPLTAMVTAAAVAETKTISSKATASKIVGERGEKKKREKEKAGYGGGMDLKVIVYIHTSSTTSAATAAMCQHRKLMEKRRGLGREWFGRVAL